MSLVAFGEFIFQRLVTNQLFAYEFCVAQLDTFYHQQDHEKVIFWKNRGSLSLFGLPETRKKQPMYRWLKVGTFWPKFDIFHCFHQHSQPFYDSMQKEIEKIEFVQGANFEFIDSLKSNGTKYLLNFDDSCVEICKSKAFIDIATAGKHCGLSTFYFKHNLFHQGKFVRDVELQIKHIVLFESPRDLMQISTLSPQLLLGSELVDWYRNATPVPYGHSLVDLSPQTDDRVRYCTNTGSIPSKFLSRTDWKIQNFWTMNTQNLSTFQFFQTFSH